MPVDTLIITDNPQARDVALELRAGHGNVDIVQSPKGQLLGTPKMDLKAQASELCKRYALVMSIHCKQMFPATLFESVRCVNVHPGFNPFNRGWYPQVFSLTNGLPAGVTIHVIDAQLDHGPILYQRRCEIHSWDTSATVYANIMKLERQMLLDHFTSIRDGSAPAAPTAEEGNLNRRSDFEALCRLDLEAQGTFGEFLNRLRGLTHDDFRNAYFIDGNGKKVFVRIHLEPED